MTAQYRILRECTIDGKAYKAGEVFTAETPKAKHEAQMMELVDKTIRVFSHLDDRQDKVNHKRAFK